RRSTTPRWCVHWSPGWPPGSIRRQPHGRRSTCAATTGSDAVTGPPDAWTRYARAAPWNLRAEDAHPDGRILASATVQRSGDPVRVHLLYRKRPGTAGYALAESWTGTVFARWMRDGDLVEVGPRRAGRQEVRRR